MSGWVPVFVAVITGPLMWLLVKFDRRNSSQHDSNLTRLVALHEDVKEVKADVRAVKLDMVTVKADITDMKHDHRVLARGAKKLSERLRLVEDHEVSNGH
jgi:hypothetical protein